MEKILRDRLEKLERLEKEVDPYPNSFAGENLTDIIREGDPLASEEKGRDGVRLAGRITAIREHGSIYFIDLRQGFEKMQLLFREGESERYSLLFNLDIGDFLGVEGELTRSKRGELTILAKEWQMLSKSLRPLPDKFHGLQDTEQRFRQRELDLLANKETFITFQIRSRVIEALRRVLSERGFLEVETPILQPVYGGALARPFQTHHNTLDQEMYLRIASELYLKRCLVGGIDRVFEIGKNFRNEGISRKHNPEFTVIEYYEAYADYKKMADDFEKMISRIARESIKETTIIIEDQEIDLSLPWKRISFRNAVLEASGIDVLDPRARDLMTQYLGEESSFAEMADKIFSSEVEPTLLQPTFVFDYPIEMSPLAKRHPDDERLVERWEAFLGGQEIANAFSELNDPREQKKRFLAQEKSEEAQPYDKEFIRALEHGMPPAGGVGLGIDRLVMLLLGRDSLREVILFPALRNRD